MKSFIVAILFILSAHLSFAQWNINTSVNLEVAALSVADLQTASTSDGKTWIAFYSANGANYDMRAQLLDANGNKLLGPNGVLVSNQVSGSATFVFNVCVDGFNSLIIAFQYEVAGVLSSVVTKVNTDGSLPWGNGTVLGAGLAPYPAVTKTNEVFVAWNNDSPSTLYIQKVSSAGAIMWGSPVGVTVGTSNTTRGQIAANSNGDFTMVFQKRSFGISTTLYAQRYTTNGVPIWTAPIQLCNLTTSGARYYSILVDGNTTYFGYYASSGFRFASYLQKIYANGTLPWGINGSPFSTYSAGADPLQQATSIAHASSSNYIWAVATFCDIGQTQYGVYVQKFDTASGAVQLNPVGKEVFPISTSFDTQSGGLTLINDGPLFMSYDVNYKIYGTRLNSAGDFVWASNRVELSSTTASAGNAKGRFAFSGILNDQGVAVWYENRGVEYRAYAQNIPPSGVLPITVVDFGATKNGKFSNLYWTSKTEINCVGFDIERSDDGIHFSKIGFVKSNAINGTSFLNLNYSFTDLQPLSSNNYYRLKQFDADGKFGYSKIILLQFNTSADLIISSTYPNPTKDLVHMDVVANKKSNAVVYIVDAGGRIVKKIVVELNVGNNKLTVPVSDLARAVYYLKINCGEKEMVSDTWIKD